MRFLYSEFGKDIDPLKTINVLQASCCSIEAWEVEVTSTTIKSCWVKARVRSAKYGPRTLDEKNDLGWKDRVEIEETEQRAVT